MSFDVNTRTNKVVAGSEYAVGVKIPKKDSFLSYRALGINDLKVPITEYFIKERGMSKVGYGIDIDYIEPNGKDTLCALCLDYNGTVLFNKLYKHKSKHSVVKTARHEVEHCWQYYLDGRNTGGGF